MKKWTALLLALVLAMAIGAWLLLRAERNDERRMQDLYTLVEPLQKEREATGLYLSGHPLDDYMDEEICYSLDEIRIG